MSVDYAQINARLRVLLASPFAPQRFSTTEQHVEYAKTAMLDSIERGEAPFAPHLVYPEILHDRITSERMKGIECGLAWLRLADKLVLYTDYGITEGMRIEIEAARARGMPVEYRSLQPATGE